MDLSNYVAELSFQYSARRYGAGYNLIDVECNIEKNGSAIVKRTVEVCAHSQLSDLDTFLLIPRVSSVSNEAWTVGFSSIKSLTDGRIITLGEVEEEFGRSSVMFNIAPPLFDGACVTYKMVEDLPINFYAVGYTQEALENRQTKDDFFGWTINRPTQKLSLRVSFPTGDEPQLYNGEVRYASASGFSAKRFQYEEQKRLRPVLESWDGDRHVLKLEVDYPMTGLVYILRWTPEPAKKLKTASFIKESALSDSELRLLRDLRQIFTTRYNEGELRSLCFDLGMDYGSLPGKGQSDKVIELITYFNRRKQLSELIRLAKIQRQDIAWPE